MPVSPRLPACILACALAASPAALGRDVPYVPTPEPVVDRMLQMVEAGPEDVVYDLGSGDGRIVIAAVRDFGVKKGIGIDIDPVRISEANANAARVKVADRTQFKQADIFRTDFSEATVVTMYLLNDVNLKLRPRLLNELRPGTRLVSHQFDMGDWQADAEDALDGHLIYHWIVPARVQGRWTGTVGGESLALEFDQAFQRVSGEIRTLGGSGAVRNGRLVGEKLTFEAEIARRGGRVAARFDGRATPEGNLEGTLTTAEGSNAVRASRTHRAAAPAQ